MSEAIRQGSDDPMAQEDISKPGEPGDEEHFYGKTEMVDGNLTITDVVDKEGNSVLGPEESDDQEGEQFGKTEMVDGKLTITDVVDKEGNSVLGPE